MADPPNEPAPEADQGRPGLARRLRAQRVRRPLRTVLSEGWAERQHRNTIYLLLNNVFAAATGLLFWLLIVRLTQLDTATIGLGYTLIALGTVVGVIAKGGLDTALVRSLPRTGREHANRLLLLAMGIGLAAALLLCALLFGLSFTGLAFEQLGLDAWLIVAAIAALLVITWLQDAYFLGEGDAKHSFQRNAVFGTSRLALPLLLVALAFPQPVALSWALGLGFSALLAAYLILRLPHRAGPPLPRKAFFHSAARNISGSAAEFVPGLLLVPLVLITNGATAAAYFGIAWTAASLLFLACSAISRSTLAELVRRPPHEQAQTLRRGIRQQLAIVAPSALAVAILAPLLLRVFGTAYAQNGATALTLLALSTLFVAPAYYYLAYLRAHEQALPLVLLPIFMIVALALLAPFFADRWGIEGVAMAWLLANIPFALYSTVKLRQLAREVRTDHAAPNLGHLAYVE